MSVTSAVSADGNTRTISIIGRFDFNLQQDFRSTYESSEDVDAYVLDLSQVSYLDSSALGMLLLLRDHAGGETANIQIAGANDTIKELLEISSFGKLFDIT